MWLSNIATSQHLTGTRFTEMRGVWKSIEGFAYNDDLISRRIIHDIEKPERNLFADEKPRYKETAVFTLEELDQLSEQALDLYSRSHFNTAYLGLCLDSYVGFRAGELSCLRWDCIDFKNKTITIRQAEAPHYESIDGELRTRGYEIIDHLKCHHTERKVPLPDQAEAVLKYIRKESLKHGVLSDYVFVQRNGERVHTRAFQKALRKVYKELGWEGIKDTGIHECRRTYASTLMDNDVPDKKVQGYMGHKDWVTTKRHYQFPSQESDPSAAEAVSMAFRKA